MSICFQALIDWHIEFRSALFLSSVTLGTFLFTMKSFIIQTMKKEVYDNKQYQKVISKRRAENSKEEFYKPLKNLARLIFWSIILAFLSAFSQVSLGYIEKFNSVVICLLIAIVSWVVVIVTLFLVSTNLTQMISIAESEAQENDSGE